MWAEYSLEDVINGLLYASTSTSTSNSIEAAVADIKRKYKNKNIKIPSADTIHGYIKMNEIENILSFFRNINSELINQIINPNKSYDVAIDFHDMILDIMEKRIQRASEVRGIKAKNGTSWDYTYMTIDIIGNCKFTPNIINISSLNKNYSILLESMLQMVQSMGIRLGTLFLDREFFNISSVSTIHKVNYIMGE